MLVFIEFRSLNRVEKITVAPRRVSIHSQSRKNKALFNWVARLTGVDSCWIEGIDDNNQPIWALTRRLSKTCWSLISRKLKATVGIAALGGTLFFLTDSLHAQTRINLSNLTGFNGFTLSGVNHGDRSGYAVSSGDINGDGINDMIIGAHYADPNGVNAAGETYVVFGKSTAFTSTVGLSSLDGSTGFVLLGINDGDQSGYSVSSGDINGDGTDDVIIGAQEETYVVFGFDDTAIDTLELSSLDGNTGFALRGIEVGRSGNTTSSGDINGDGTDDVIIGSKYASPNGMGSGKTYVVFGKSTAFTSSMELSLLDGSAGFVLNGINRSDRSGDALYSGDINGDTYDDVIIGAHNANGGSGETYVVFGKNSFASSVELSSLDGSTGFVLNGVDARDYSGSSVSSGDINGDGRYDVIIGASGAASNGNRSGESYVVFGKSSFASSIELSSLDGNAGFVLNGIDNFDWSGWAVSSGNINGDIYDDIIIGAHNANGNSGETYVVFGFNNAATDTLELSSLDGSMGFMLNGISGNDKSGRALSSGDINGDGTDDVILGAYNANSGSGETFVFTQFPVAGALKGGEGFRMLAVPTSGTVLDEFLEPLWTQGMTGADTPNGPSNIWLWNEDLNTNGDITDAGDWISVTDISSQYMTFGQGFLMHVFADDNNDGTAEGFPKMLSTINIHNSAVVDTGTATPVNNLDHGRFFLLGNPFPFTIDWISSGISRTNMSNTIYVWDNVNGKYLTWNGIAGNPSVGEITPFQSFFVQGFGNGGSLSIEAGTAFGSTVVLIKQVQAQHKALKIRAETGSHSAEAWLSFQEGGELGHDIYDGLLLQPFGAEFLKLGTIISSEQVLQINALPVDQQEQLVIPLDLSGTLEASHATLSFEGLEAFEGWELFLRDTLTREVFSINNSTSLELEIEPIRTKFRQPALPMPVPMKEKTAGSRYHIVLTPRISVHDEPDSKIPSAVELEQNYPNPFNPFTTIEFSVPTQGTVHLEVFDIMGRKVAELINQSMKPGRYSVNFDASALSSGVYLYILQTASASVIRRMTLIK